MKHLLWLCEQEVAVARGWQPLEREMSLYYYVRGQGRKEGREEGPGLAFLRLAASAAVFL